MMMDQEANYYRAMLRIRRFEETILEQFKRRFVFGHHAHLTWAGSQRGWSDQSDATG